MKNLVLLYGGDLTCHVFNKVFGSKSAFEKVLEWADVFSEKIILLIKNGNPVNENLSSFCSVNSKLELISKDYWTKSDLISEIASSLKKYDCKSVIFSYADTPFLNEKLTRELIGMHDKYSAEYSFADGFPYGLAPELLESGTASILSELAKTNLKTEGGKTVDREALFSVIKGDINSFEIETLIADEDYRLLRFSFESSSKINALACKNLFEEAQNQKIDLNDAYAISTLASKKVSVMQTVPAFYNIQISSKYNHKYSYSLESYGKNPAAKDFMSLEDFKTILNQITDFSENAVISLSAFGEPLLNPHFADIAREVLSKNNSEHKISLLIETDGLLITEELASNLLESAQKNHTELNWIVYLDAVDKSMYAKLHNCAEDDFEKALDSISLLEKYFENHVYPQFMRMKTNENQLEAFYRYWNEKESPSKGQLIIQKYNSFCGVLPDLKSADLSPVNRIPCWHLRRDFTILSDGTVPYCFQLSFKENAGNVLTDGIEKVWKRFGIILENHLSCYCSGKTGQAADNCSICDEFYTFNF